MPFNITIGPSLHGSDDSSLSDEEDSSGVQVSPPSENDYHDPYDEWAHLPYPDELKPSDSASRPRTSHRTRSRNPTHGSASGRRHHPARQQFLQERAQFSHRRRPPSPESPESVDSAEEYGNPYGRPSHERKIWSQAGQGPGYASSSSPGPSYVYPNGAVPHSQFGHPNAAPPPSDQLIRLGHHNQYGQPAQYNHSAYPYNQLQQPHGPMPPFLGHDGHPGHPAHPTHPAHQTRTSSRSRSEGHGQTQHPLTHGLPPHNPSPFSGSMSPHELVSYQPGAYYHFREPYGMVPGMVPPYFNAYPRVPSPSQIEPAGPHGSTMADPAKDEAIARLEKLILEERMEREAKDLREANERAAIQQEAAERNAREMQAAREKHISEESAALAKAEAEQKAADEAAKAKKEAEDAAAAAALEAATKLEAANAATQEAIDAANANKPPEKKKPIKFKDAVGRKFSFPYDLCYTWQGMEELIRQAFLHIEVIGPHVAEGHYDLIGPNGDIILPQVWETVIEPDWAITMHMWPIPEPPKEDPPPPDAAAPADAEAAKKAAGAKKAARPKPDPGSFAMWMVGSGNRAKLNKALKAGKKPRVVQHGSSCRVM
ncbi:hypothetical protein FE257_000699 [Aspergillus nanangensis]|uniref:Ubiquitin-like domain-containing protein n=1 Tax=Aspergillus nanangensis TaxID=2582783 RepID=A0AAD4CGA5_ASPNN|nr:hypothetical protein FE257_000699 [Aspergillus nanangensis]